MTKLDEEEIYKRLEDLQDWDYTDNALTTSFEFNDFKEAFSVMVRIAFEAESQQHHPEWFNVFNKVQISLSTHDAGGVTEKDFTLAQTIERVVGTAE